MPFTLESHLEAGARAQALRADVLEGLRSTPKSLPPKYFYDERGSELFDAITRLPEYYPTRAERSILEAHAKDVAATCGAQTLIELGSGTSEKTVLLIEALRSNGSLERFVPFDVDPSVLQTAGETLTASYPELTVQAVAGDFEHHLSRLPGGGTRLLAFLGSTIGNFEPAPRAAFLSSVADTLAPGDFFLLGTDLVKDRQRLVAAYDDAAGVTAAFNKNVLEVLNRELNADADRDAFAHVALWDEDNSWIEMRLRSLRAQQLHVGDLSLTVDFAEGEEMRTEVSTKFRRETVESELAAAGLTLTEWWTDGDGDFALSLSTPTG